MRILLSILLWLLMFPVIIYGNSFRHLNVEEGLSSRQVFQICTDSAGFVWCFTYMGVDRYDGSEIRHYKLDNAVEAKDHILSSTVMCCDSKGELWIGMKNGKVYSYDRLKDRFYLYVDLLDHLPDNTSSLNNLYFDQDNQMWLALSSGLYQFDRDSQTLISIPQLKDTQVTCLTQSASGTLFAGGTRSVFILEKKADNTYAFEEYLMPQESRIESLYFTANKLYIGTFSNSLWVFDLMSKEMNSLHSIIPSVPVRVITSADEQILLVGTDGAGFYQLNIPDHRLLRRYTTDEDDKKSLSGNTVTDIMVDERQCIWIATNTNGISLLEPDNQEARRIKHEYGNINSLASDHVNVVMEDSDGDLWYGTNNGVSMYNTRTGKWQHYLNDKGEDVSHSPVVLALFEDEQKNIWIGGYGIGVYYINKEKGSVHKLKKHLSSNNAGYSDYIYTIYGGGEHIWMGGIEGYFTCYNTRTDEYTFFPIDCIGSIQPYKNGSFLLAGCEGMGVFDLSMGKTSWHRTFNEQTLRYPIRSLHWAADGKIWLASDGEGLICFDPDSGSSQFFTTKNGLSSNSINNVQEDQRGNIWFSTEDNLYCLNRISEKIMSMNEFIGIERGNYNPNAAILLRNGDLIFGTADGAVCFDPNFEWEERAAIPVLFTDFKLFYRSLEPGAEGSPLTNAINETASVSLRHNQNSFSIYFSSINFRYPHQTVYHYKLNGFDADWRISGSQHNAYYMNLAPGKYTFRIKALNKYTNQILGEREVDIIVGKPFWASGWAVMIYVLLAAALVFLFVRYRKPKTVQYEEKEPEELDDSNDPDREFLEKAQAVIEAQLADPNFSINEFCRELGMSRTSVYNKIKSLTDMAPNDFIRIIRLNRANELLKTKKYSISEVSYRVGFSDPKYFSTSFKKHFGVSPSKVN